VPDSSFEGVLQAAELPDNCIEIKLITMRGASMYRIMLLALLAGVATGQNSPTSQPMPANQPPADMTSSARDAAAAPSTQGVPSASPSQADPSRAESAQREREGRDPLFDLPPLPKDSRVSLIGGRIVSIDRVLDRIELQPFGGKKTELAFDVRTQFLRDGAKIAPKDIRAGDRVYADTMLDNNRRVFAKTIRVVTKLRDNDRGHGQVVSYEPGTGKLIMRDELLSRPLTLHLTRDTVIRKDQGRGSIADLKPGSLIAVSFTPGGEGLVQEVSVLAIPGTSFVFAGPITHLDLASHLLVVSNKTDGKTYEIDFDPARLRIANNVREGSEVNVDATFDGKRYVAQTMSLIPESKQSNQ
jgi:hypothetical protein